MPKFINKVTAVDNPLNLPTPYASEEEVLAFANKLRELGGAEVLGSFFPSSPGSASSCLIANALNFGCCVKPIWPRAEHGEFAHWVMEFPCNILPEKIVEIAEALGCKLADERTMRLPRLIGNAANAFDEAPAAEHHWVVKYRESR